ncbi:MAG: ABC transporter substrate-binding protein [Burkholderiales bacterium]
MPVFSIPFRRLGRAALFGLIGAFTAIGIAAAAELRIALSADITTLDPHFVAAQPNLTAQMHIFDALVRVDERGRIVPGLATSWTTPDPLTWELKLRPGVKFHDGSDLTIEDIVFSLERPLTIKGSPGGYAAYVRMITAKMIVDKHTLRLKTTSPYGPLLEDLAHVLIVSRRAAFNASGDDFDSGKAAIGTGPFKLTKFARGDRVTLARHDAHWAGAAPWDSVTLRILPNDPTRTAALLSGELDAIENVPTADLPRLRKSAAHRLAQVTSWRTILLHLDQHRTPPPGVTDKAGKPLAANPFKDVRVRQALSKALNREAIAARIMEGLGLPAANVVSPSIVGHDAAVKPERYDPDGAKKLLAAAGYPNGFNMTLAAPNNRYINDEQVAQACAQMFSRIGIATKVEAMPVAAYLGKARNQEFGVALLGWGSLAADLALRSLAATPDPDKGRGAWNWARYSNPALDKLIEQSLATVDLAKRELAAREASALAAREVAFIPLHYQVVTWAMKRSLDYTARTDEFTYAHQFRAAK